MSTGKRLAKRSILGTRVVAPGEDGLYCPGVIQAVKTSENSVVANRYSVRFDLTRKVREYPESEIIGPGFAGLTGIKLRPGQIVYVTYCNREMQGSVVCHRPNIDQVIVRLLNGGPEVKKKLEEVRLLESRKSARLIGHGNTDFSKLADFNIVHERKRLNSETSDMSSGTSGRKRRGSDTLSDSSDEGDYGFSWSSSEERATTPVMSECTAAMVLMNLSHAQMASKQSTEAVQQRMMQFMHRNGGAASTATTAAAPTSATEDTQNSPQDLSTTSLLSTVPSSSANPATFRPASPSIQDGSSSPLSSTSGASSLGSSWTPSRGQQPSPQSSSSSRATPTSIVSQQQIAQQVANLTEAEALLQLSNCQESDEGIVSDQSSVTDPEDPTAKRFKTEHVRIIYQCTWPRCGIKMDTCSEMERHVRSQHLMKPSASVDDLEGEEEFYYTEIEVPLHHHDFAVLLSQGNGGQVAANAVRINKQPHHVKSLFSTSAPANVTAILQNLPSNLADHMDMARPPHENPEYNFAQNSIGGTVAVGAGSQASNTAFTAVNPRPAHHQPRRSYPPPPPAFSSITAAVPIAIPVTNLSFARSAPPAHSSSHPHGLSSHPHHHHGKYIRLSPKPTPTSSLAGSPAALPQSASASASASMASAMAAAAASTNLLNLQQQHAQQHPQPQASAAATVKSSPIRRPRGDAKKCRKVYGMDHRDLWCTQCKWKKACTRFGNGCGQCNNKAKNGRKVRF